MSGILMCLCEIENFHAHNLISVSTRDFKSLLSPLCYSQLAFAPFFQGKECGAVLGWAASPWVQTRRCRGKENQRGEPWGKREEWSQKHSCKFTFWPFWAFCFSKRCRVSRNGLILDECECMHCSTFCLLNRCKQPLMLHPSYVFFFLKYFLLQTWDRQCLGENNLKQTWCLRYLFEFFLGLLAGGGSDALFSFCAQILLGGLELDQDNNVVLLDQELASMRIGRAFLSQINDHIPRNWSSMMQMASMLGGQRSRPLPPAQFDRVVLSLVYSAQQGQQQDAEEQRQAWAGLLLQLANITVHELRGSYLFSYAWVTRCHSGTD